MKNIPSNYSIEEIMAVLPDDITRILEPFISELLELRNDHEVATETIKDIVDIVERDSKRESDDLSLEIEKSLKSNDVELFFDIKLPNL